MLQTVRSYLCLISDSIFSKLKGGLYTQFPVLEGAALECKSCPTVLPHSAADARECCPRVHLMPESAVYMLHESAYDARECTL